MNNVVPEKLDSLLAIFRESELNGFATRIIWLLILCNGYESALYIVFISEKIGIKKTVILILDFDYQGLIILFGIIFIFYGLWVFGKVFKDILLPKSSFTKNLSAFGIDEVNQALKMHENFPTEEERRGLFAFAEMRRDQFKDRSGVILAFVAVFIYVLGGKDSLQSTNGLLALGGIIGLGVVIFSFLNSNQTSGGVYVCSVLKLASSLSGVDLKRLKLLLERENSDPPTS